MSVSHTEEQTGGMRLRRLAPWIAGLVLVAGIVAAIAKFAPDKNAPAGYSSPTPKTKVAPPAKSIPFGADQRRMALQFIKTAVARKNLDRAWGIVGPNIRAGLTHREWMTGVISVVPYPNADWSLRHGAPFKIDYSNAKEAQIEIVLSPPPGAKIKPQLFVLGERYLPGSDGKRHWVVDNWVPKSAPIVHRGND